MAFTNLEEYKKKLEAGYNPYRARRMERDISIDTRQINNEADQSMTSRFLGELGKNLNFTNEEGILGKYNDLPKEMAQGTARTIAGLPLALMKGGDATLTPTNRFSEAVFGTDEAFNLKGEGGDFLSVFGASEQTQAKYGLGVGAVIGLLDFVPGGKSVSTLNRVASSVSKTDDVATIAKNLRVVLDGEEEAIQSLAQTLKGVTDKREAQRLISEAGATTKGASVNELADTIRASGVSREKYLADLQKGLSNPSSRSGQRAVNIATRLRRNGLTPEAFYDGLVAGKPLRRSPVPDSAAKRSVGDTTRSARRTVPESTLLRERIRTLDKGIREGTTNTRRVERGKAKRATQAVRASETSKAITSKRLVKNIQEGLTKRITDNLPVAYRGSLLKKIKNTTTPKQFDKALDAVDKKIEAYRQAAQLRKQLGNRRSKLAFINKLNDLKQSAVRDMKQTLGINKPVKQMNAQELDAMIAEATKRFKFKRNAGAPQNVVRADGTIGKKKKAPPAGRVSDEAREKLAGLPNESFRTKVGDSMTNAKDSLSQTGDLINIMSTELKIISKELWGRLRRYDAELRMMMTKDVRVAERYWKSLRKAKRKMTVLERREYEFALFNGHRDTAYEIAKKYGFDKELDNAIKMKDDIYERAKKQGFKLGYQKNHFPRRPKNDAASSKKILDYFESSGRLTEIQQAWADKSHDLGRVLTDHEKAKIATLFFRGFNGRTVSLKETGNMKARLIDEVPPELMDAYEDSTSALLNYAQEMNTRIETKKFFNGQVPNDGLIDETSNLEDAFSALFAKLEGEGKFLDTNQQRRVQELLRARFASGTMSGGVQVVKNLGYMSLMNSPLNVISQLPDLAWAIYQTGIISGTGSLIKSIRRQGAVSRAESGFDDVAAEIEEAGNLHIWVTRTFRAIGLHEFDVILKETTMDAAFNNHIRLAKTKDPEFVDEVRVIFNQYPEQADEVLDKMARGVNDEDTKLMAIARLHDFQPVSLSEVPTQYLKAGNGKIFYQMKTFFTKQLDIVRRDVIQQARKGEYKSASKNLIKITTLLVLMNATADEVKDYITGRNKDTKFSDRLTENFFKTFFSVNRYKWEQTQREGFFSAIVGGELSIPALSVGDNAFRDVSDLLSSETDMSIDQSRSIRNVPGAGQLYYWWFGRGAETTSSPDTIRERSSRNSERGSSRGSSRSSTRESSR